jgi:hypothetical protein
MDEHFSPELVSYTESIELRSPDPEPSYPPKAWFTDVFAWIHVIILITYAATSIILSAQGKEPFPWIYLPYIMILCVVMYTEAREARRLQIILPSTFMVLLLPVYLWQRLSILKQPRHHFWIWMVVFACSATLDGYTGYSVQEDKAIRQTVQELVADQLKKINISEPFRISLRQDRKGDYSGMVTLQSGGLYQIHVQLIENQVFVQFR